jgi:hypothetical protein
VTATGADGSFSFSGLRAGSYQLVVPIDATVAAALAANDVAYGGPGTGYAFSLGVGESKSQPIPFDITHTTVAFSVSLRSGDEMGDALPGAMVQLYGTGNAMVGSGPTGDDGSVAIKVARAMTSGNMVNAGVSADGYDVADGMTEVSWDPQMFATTGSNANDIVNLNVDVSISGATVDRGDYGGGEALAGWAIDVMMGDAAVAGAPTALGDDGSAAFTTTVASVPASFTFMVADDQDDDLDGGEMYEASGGSYTHTGLKVAGTMDGDPIVVTYKTQTLKVYVHHELDQVRGFTGNVGHRDDRMSDLVDLEIRHASGSDGRFTSAISNDDWDARANSDDDEGVYTFSHLPADMDIVVRAEARDGYKLLDKTELDAYRNMDENGVMGGAFGAMGGFGHTVALCPLEEVEPTGQDFGDCASFGVVSLHNVNGLVWKRSVAADGTGFKVTDPKFESGVEVSLAPVDGKNLAGVGGDFTTTSKNDPTTAFDDTHEFAFGDMAAGSYDLKVSDGWRVMLGGKGSEDPVGNALDPLGADVALDVTPMTTSLYGFVRNEGGFPLEGLTVTANGQTAMTDALGRYIVSGVAAAAGKKINASIARDGYPTKKASTAFVANTPTQLDITLSGARTTVAITGTVTETLSGAGIKGVEIEVNGDPPLNASGGKLQTGDDGTYTAIVEALPISANVTTVQVTATKKGYHFQPPSHPAVAIAGSTNQTANFQGYRATEITGSVLAPGHADDEKHMSDVTVTAYDSRSASGELSDKLASVTTTETGTFSLFVPTLSGDVFLEAKPRDTNASDFGDDYTALSNALKFDWFDPPASRENGQITVIPHTETMRFGAFEGYSVQPRITKVTRPTLPDVAAVTTGSQPIVHGETRDSIVVTWKYDTRSSAAAYAAAVGATVTLETKHGRPDFAAPEGAAATSEAEARTAAQTDGISVTHTRTTRLVLATPADDVDYGDISVRIGNTVTGADATAGTEIATGAAMPLDGVASSVTDLAAKVATSTANTNHNLTATWYSPASPQLDHRVLVAIPRGGETRWYRLPITEVATPLLSAPPDAAAAGTVWRNTARSSSNYKKWSMTAFNLNQDIVATDGAALVDDVTGVATGFTAAQLRGATDLRIDTSVAGGAAGTWMTRATTPISR